MTPMASIRDGWRTGAARQAATLGQQEFIITSEAPIDAPIVILGP